MAILAYQGRLSACSALQSPSHQLTGFLPPRYPFPYNPGDVALLPLSLFMVIWDKLFPFHPQSFTFGFFTEPGTFTYLERSSWVRVEIHAQPGLVPLTVAVEFLVERGFLFLP